MSVGASTTAALLAAVIVSQHDDPTTDHRKLIHSIRMAETANGGLVSRQPGPQGAPMSLLMLIGAIGHSGGIRLPVLKTKKAPIRDQRHSVSNENSERRTQSVKS